MREEKNITLDLSESSHRRSNSITIQLSKNLQDKEIPCYVGMEEISYNEFTLTDMNFLIKVKNDDYIEARRTIRYFFDAMYYKKYICTISSLQCTRPDTITDIIVRLSK